MKTPTLYCCYLAVALLLSACVGTLHEPAPNLAKDWKGQTWRIYCETAESHAYSPDAEPGLDKERWLWMEDRIGNQIRLDGYLEDGFLVVEGLRRIDGTPILRPKPSAQAVRDACLFTLDRLERDKPLKLGSVRAARNKEKINVAMVFAADRKPAQTVQRVVIFGDSLSDTGLLKSRLRVFPDAPYWMGRFSNGPVWVDYLEAQTGLAVQNHAYGGAAITRHARLPGEGLIDRIKMGGQYWVSGSIALQIDDYILNNLEERTLKKPGETLFIVWAGANDYISKEPVSGLITSFLNSPEGESGYHTVVDNTLAALAHQLRRLHLAGARKMIVINMPDLGHSPIVLQNKTYAPKERTESDASRRLTFASHLSALTAYHNQGLAVMIENLQTEFPEMELVLQDANHFIDAMVHGNSPIDQAEYFEFGFTLAKQRELLSSGDNKQEFFRSCYTGGYLGTKDPQKVCANQASALFWDNVHPSSYTHCWQSWFISKLMADKGWLEQLPELDDHRAWCGQVSGRIDGLDYTSWMLSAE